MQIITLSLSETTFHKLKRATEFNQRSINDLVVALIETSSQPSTAWPPQSSINDLVVALIETLVPAQQVNEWPCIF